MLHVAGSFELEDVSVAYSGETAVAGVCANIAPNRVTALIGPSGCGKSTLLRCLNRMNDMLGNVEVGGTITLDGEDINHGTIDPVELRMRVGMVFQQPSVFPLSIYDNVAYGPRLRGVKSHSDLDPLVEDCLRRAALWDEVKDELSSSALGLSGGQQQRLCIARTLAMKPDVVLFDEPCSALDPISTYSIEETIRSIASTGICCIIVTHNMEQATRVSDRTAFFYVGNMVETGTTKQIFSTPNDQRLADYLSGRFG